MYNKNVTICNMIQQVVITAKSMNSLFAFQFKNKFKTADFNLDSIKLTST